MGAYYLGIDIGTYSSKGVIVDEQGKVVVSHDIAHSLSIPHDGWAEHNAKQVWWGEFIEICQTLLRKSGVTPAQIKAIGHSAMSPCILCADEQGEPLHNAILYGIDTRAVEQQRSMEQQIGHAQIYQLSGVTLSSQSVTPKLLWIQEHLPQVWQKAHFLFSASGYLTYQLTGRYCLNYYDAIGYPGLYDVENRAWSEQFRHALIGDKALPDLLWASEFAGRITAQAAKLTGLQEGTPVLPGCADAASEALAAGIKAVGDTMMMYGSSTFFISRTERLPHSPIFWGNHFLEPETYVISGGTATCGSLISWYLKQFGAEAHCIATETQQSPYAVLMQEFSMSTPGANGLICLPYFSGERTPVLDNRAKGMLMGLSLHHTHADVYRSVLEGIAMSLRHNLETLSKEGFAVAQLFAVGGGTHNPYLMQAVSDITQKKQQVPQVGLGACYGDCLMSAKAIGQFTSLDEAVENWVTHTRHYTPQALTKIYDPLYTLYLELYMHTKPLMQQLHQLKG
ncbi:TPA: FGGY-family carbohydrate kinase [Vibrio cholerae]